MSVFLFLLYSPSVPSSSHSIVSHWFFCIYSWTTMFHFCVSFLLTSFSCEGWKRVNWRELRRNWPSHLSATCSCISDTLSVYKGWVDPYLLFHQVYDICLISDALLCSQLLVGKKENKWDQMIWGSSWCVTARPTSGTYMVKQILTHSSIYLSITPSLK